MKLGLLYAAAFALSLSACATESTDSDEQLSGNNAGCKNTDEVCYCIDQSDCPSGTTCQIADSPLPPYQGICFPNPPCNSNTDPNCTPPPPPSCENNTDPNCDNTPPPGCENNTDPNCNNTPPPPPPPPGCENNTDPNCCNAPNC